MYDINFYQQLLERSSLFKHEKVFQIIGIVLTAEQSIKSFTYIFQGIRLIFKSTFTIFKEFRNDFRSKFRGPPHDGRF